MSRPANKKVIGAFVLGAIALLIVSWVDLRYLYSSHLSIRKSRGPGSRPYGIPAFFPAEGTPPR